MVQVAPENPHHVQRFEIETAVKGRDVKTHLLIRAIEKKERQRSVEILSEDYRSSQQSYHLLRALSEENCRKRGIVQAKSLDSCHLNLL